MWKRLQWSTLLLWFLLFTLENTSIWVCGSDSNNLTAKSTTSAAATTASTASRNGKPPPLRDIADYDQPDKNAFDEDSYDEEYNTFDGDHEQFPDTVDDNDVQHKIPLRFAEDEEDESEEVDVDVGHARMETSSTTAASIASVESSAIELCPKECSCLNDFMDCNDLISSGHTDRLPHVPQWVSNLELSHNDFDAERCTASIRNLSNLVELKLNQNKLTRIPLFVGLISLQRLDLASNQIDEISSDALMALPQLNHLDLSRNAIHTIAPGTFYRGNRLRKLNLNGNQINRLDRRSLEALTEMTELKLNQNRIHTIPTGLFTNLKKLKKLSLSSNDLQNNLQHAMFSNLTSLTTLKLRSNSITELMTGVFRGLLKLTVLDLGNNKLTEMHKDGLLNITMLSKLILSNNSIHTIGKNCWEFTQKITNLDLSANHLTDITQNTFESLTRLQHLDLHANAISTIRPGAFNGTQMLETLDLSQNRISWTIEDTFGPFSSLQMLDTFMLNDNHIKTINRNAFLGLQRLTHLDLRNNNITTIQDGAFGARITPKLSQLLMNTTFLICDCNLSSFYRWVKESSIEMQRDVVNVRCAYPANVRGSQLLLLPKNNLTCHDTPKPRLIDEPKSPFVAIKGTNVTLECTAVLTVGTTVLFKWKNDNVDIGDEFVETKFRKKEETRQRIQEKLLERRRKANRNSMRPNMNAPKSLSLPLSSASKYRQNNDDYDEDDDDDDDEEEENEGSDLDLNGESADDLDGVDEESDDTMNADSINNSIPANSTIVTSVLHLNNVNQNDAGRYQCIVSNKFGTTYSHRFKVSVASFPVFTKRPVNVTADASSTVRLDCAVDGDPKPVLFWQFNFGNDFPAARERRMHVMPDDDAFFIINAKLSDQGVYTCTATNEAGVIKANATVVIREPPKLAKPMENKDAIVGESTVITCMKSGSPSPTIQWFKDNQRIEPSERHFFTDENQLLIIEKTIESDAGVYKCEIENPLGKIGASMTLSVRTVLSAANEIDGYTKGINVDEMTAIVIITVVCCAIATSIIWVAIIWYQTKEEGGCASGGGGETATVSNGINNNTTKSNRMKTSNHKENNLLVSAATNISMLPKGDEATIKLNQPMRTATILRNSHGIIRSSSGSSCGHSSAGISDDIFRHYKDTPTHQPGNRAILNTESDEDEPNNDDEALLGAAYYCKRYPKIDGSEKDQFVIEMHDGVDSLNNDTDAGNTTTAECVDDDQLSPMKTKASASLSSSCQSIPPLPYNASREFDSQIPYNGSVSSNVSVTPPLCNGTAEATTSFNGSTSAMPKPSTSSSTSASRPVIPSVPIARAKPMSTFKK